MRVKEGFVIREVAGQILVIATGEASKDFHGMVKLNETGKDIWLGLQQGLSVDEIAARIETKYNVESAVALQDVEEFVANMREMGFLADE